jgi:hypothetical protein
VLVLVEHGQADAEGASALSAQNYVDRVRPVVSAGADRIASTLGVAPTDGSLSHMIDHTLLKPDATQDQIAELCYEARKCGFAAVCVNPSYVRLCSELLKDSDVLVCTVVGFPLGATSTESKVFETQKAVRDGAAEVDMVINVGALRSRDYELVERDIASVARAYGRGKGGRVPARQGRRRGLRQDVDGVRTEWRGRGGRGPDETGGGSQDGRQGSRRHPQLRRRPKDDRRRRQPDRGQRECQDPARSQVMRSAYVC